MDMKTLDDQEANSAHRAVSFTRAAPAAGPPSGLDAYNPTLRSILAVRRCASRTVGGYRGSAANCPG
jgi:hypothetical protein